MTKPRGLGRGGPRPITRIDDKRLQSKAYEPTPELRAQVEQWAKTMKKSQIAIHLGIDQDTFDRHYTQEFERGRWNTVLTVSTLLLKKALEGNMRAMETYLRQMGGWDNRVEITGRGGGPVEVTLPVEIEEWLNGLAPEQLPIARQLVQRLRSAAFNDNGLAQAAGPDREEAG